MQQGSNQQRMMRTSCSRGCCFTSGPANRTAENEAWRREWEHEQDQVHNEYANGGPVSSPDENGPILAAPADCGYVIAPEMRESIERNLERWAGVLEALRPYDGPEG